MIKHPKTENSSGELTRKILYTVICERVACGLMLSWRRRFRYSVSEAEVSEFVEANDVGYVHVFLFFPFEEGY